MYHFISKIFASQFGYLYCLSIINKLITVIVKSANYSNKDLVVHVQYCPICKTKFLLSLLIA